MPSADLSKPIARLRALTLAATALLSACGGGSSTEPEPTAGSPTPAPAPGPVSPPVSTAPRVRKSNPPFSFFGFSPWHFVQWAFSTGATCSV